MFVAGDPLPSIPLQHFERGVFFGNDDQVAGDLLPSILLQRGRPAPTGERDLPLQETFYPRFFFNLARGADERARVSVAGDLLPSILLQLNPLEPDLAEPAELQETFFPRIFFNFTQPHGGPRRSREVAGDSLPSISLQPSEPRGASCKRARGCRRLSSLDFSSTAPKAARV